MLTYLIILLDDTATSYCHYEATKKNPKLISLDDLQSGIMFSMMENLNVQFVYPNYELPEDYMKAIDGIDHTDIKPSSLCGGDIVVFNAWENINAIAFKGSNCVIRTSRAGLSDNIDKAKELLGYVSRLNVVLTDVAEFKDNEIDGYIDALDILSHHITNLYINGKHPQLNILTDRIVLTSMNNCNAGDNNITLAPNGKFYLCPAFYYEDEGNNIGSLAEGLNIKNPQLLRLDHAPICRACDAYQCRRCIWLNYKKTLEANTPSHEQCVVAHLERNASRKLLQDFRRHGFVLSKVENIKKIDYLDPFDRFLKNKE